MEFSESLEPFNHFNHEPFGNLLDEEIPQDIFDDIMKDVNFNAMGFDVNSLSSEDSGRSSSSYDDLGPKFDTFIDQPMLDMQQIKTENIKEESIKEEPKSPMNSSNLSNDSNAMVNVRNVVIPKDQPINISQPIITTQQTFAQIQQPQFVLSQPKIVVKKEPIKFHTSSNQQQILTLQNIGGKLYTTVNPAPVQIVSGATGILTKIPIVPVSNIMPRSNPIRKTQTTVPTVSLQTTQKSGTLHVPSKSNKKSGHNIIERRYRTSIVIILIFYFFAFIVVSCNTKSKYFLMVLRTTKLRN